MKLYPAIDIKNGTCVRLRQGRAEHVTVYGEDPVAMAERFAEAGARRLHIVDLDGAFLGKGVNLHLIARMREAVPNLKLQLGGGIRTMDDIVARLDVGIDRVILGTVAIQHPELIEQALARFPGKIIAGIDAKEGMAAVNGWVEETTVSAVTLGKTLREMGVETCVYTDIARDGMLTGPNYVRTKEMMEQTGLAIIASGGIGQLEDLHRCQEMGFEGVIIGKAIYNGRIDLSEALIAYDE